MLAVCRLPTSPVISFLNTEKKTNFFFALLAVDQWFEVLDGLLGPYWKAAGLAFNCTFLLFGSVIQLIACARSVRSGSPSSDLHGSISLILRAASK